jgi:hypothetical protein
MFKIGESVYGRDKHGNAIAGTVAYSTHSAPYHVKVVVPAIDIVHPIDQGLTYILEHPQYGMLSVRFNLVEANGQDLHPVQESVL